MGQEYGKSYRREPIVYELIKSVTPLPRCKYCDAILIQGEPHTKDKCVEHLREKGRQVYDADGFLVDHKDITIRIDQLFTVGEAINNNMARFISPETKVESKRQLFIGKHIHGKEVGPNHIIVDNVLDTLRNDVLPKYPGLTFDELIACVMIFYVEHVEAKV